MKERTKYEFAPIAEVDYTKLQVDIEYFVIKDFGGESLGTSWFNGQKFDSDKILLVLLRVESPTKALSEIENVMERWHHARDEDGETLQKINNIMLEAGKLEWFNGGCTNYVKNNFTDTCHNCGKGKYFHK